MGPDRRPPLLRWVQELAALAATGLEFSADEFDRQRYRAVARIAAEMAAHPDGDPGSVADLFAVERGYVTPKIICRAAVFDDRDRILLVEEVADGRWTLPGGWVDVGESPAAAAERETREEAGYLVKAVKLAGLYDKRLHDHPPAPNHSYLVFFLCELIGGEAAGSYETSAVGWFGEEELPPLSEVRTTEYQVRRMFAHHADPGLPADFDVTGS